MVSKAAPLLMGAAVLVALVAATTKSNAAVLPAPPNPDPPKPKPTGPRLDDFGFPEKTPDVEAPPVTRPPVTRPPPSSPPPEVVPVNARAALAQRVASSLLQTLAVSGSVASAKGKEDKALVAQFQTQEGLKPDGLFGAGTRGSLAAYGISPMPPVFYLSKASGPAPVAKKEVFTLEDTNITAGADAGVAFAAGRAFTLEQGITYRYEVKAPASGSAAILAALTKVGARGVSLGAGRIVFAHQQKRRQQVGSVLVAAGQPLQVLSVKKMELAL